MPIWSGFSHAQGIPIVLLQGGRLAVGYLADLADALAGAGFRAVRINPRGTAGAPDRWMIFTLHDLPGDVAGVIQELDLGPA